MVDPIWLVWNTYISHSLTDLLTHWLIHWPVHNMLDAPTKRYFFDKKITQKYMLLAWSKSRTWKGKSWKSYNCCFSFVRSTKLTPLNLKNVLVVLIGCGSIVNNSLTSPGYPSNYPSNMDCNYSLPIPEGTYMKISFDVFELEADSSKCR